MFRMLGSRIASLRKAAGISQGELAERIGVSASAVGMYEQNRRVPSCGILLALSKALGVTVQYLLSGRDLPDCPASMLPELLYQTGAGSKKHKKRRSSLSQEETAVLLAALLTMEEPC